MGIQGYNDYRKDSSVHGGGVAMYVQNQIPTKVRSYLMYADIEVLWIQINSPRLTPLLTGCSYRPPNAKSSYLGKLCELLDTMRFISCEI